MAKICFLNPPFYPRFGREMRWQNTGRGGTLYYPIWLSYAAGVAEMKGHEVMLIDAPAQNLDLNTILKKLSSFSPDIIVVSTSFTSLTNDLYISEKLKKTLNSFIVVVGPPTSQYANKILSYNLDCVAKYEYDYTIVDLAEHIEKGKPLKTIKGIAFKKGRKIFHTPPRPWISSKKLDELPFVSKVYKKHLNIKDYFLNYSLYPMIQIFTGRGCPFNCSFCAWPQTFMGRNYRTRSVENIIEELKWIEQELPFVKEVFFEDDTFTIDKKRVRKFCELYQKEGLSLSWSCNARVDTLDLDTMKKMKKSHCRFLIVGFESANDKILKNINKGFTVRQAYAFAKKVKKARLFLHADFIIGLPGETKDTIMKTKKFIWKIKPELLQVSIVTPFPGTLLYEYLKKNKYLLTEDPTQYLDKEGHQKSVVSYPWLSSEEIEHQVDKLLKEYYFSPIYFMQVFRQIIYGKSMEELKRVMRAIPYFVKYLYRSRL